MLKILTTSFILLISVYSNGQLTKSQVENLLTNNDSRSWQFKEYKKTLGNECNYNGQLYTFFKNGNVQRIKCVNGVREFKELTWQIVPVKNEPLGEWQLNLSEQIELENNDYIKNMRIDLPLGETHRKGKVMDWRILPDCKGCTQLTVILQSTN